MSHEAPALLDTPEALAPVLDALAVADEVAVDTEFHAEGRFLPELMLVQLATRDGGPWLIDPRPDGVLDALSLALRGVHEWVVHGGSRDLAILSDALGGLPERCTDTQILAGLCTPRYPISLAALLDAELGVEVDKTTTLSDWSRRPLSTTQRRYAADDVLHLIEVADRLRGRLQELDRMALARQACADAVEDATRVAPGPHAWRAVSTRARDPHEAAIVQALLTWRAHEAARRCKPPGFLLPDTLLRRLARSRPHTLDELAADRRIRPGLIDRHGQALLDGIAAGEAHPAPPSVCPADSPASRLADLLSLVATAEGLNRGFSGALALPSTLAHAIASRPTDGLSELSGWRGALVRKPLEAAVHGRIHIVWTAGDLWSDDHSHRIGDSR